MTERKIEANDRVFGDTPSRAVMGAVTLGLAATVAIIYGVDRLYRRWWKANEPFAATRARIVRTITAYRGRRASLAESLGLAWEVFTDIDRAMGQSRASDRPRGG